MVFQGRIPLNDAENDAVNGLLSSESGQAGLSRRDPGEQGPVIVTITDASGEKVFLVDGDGNVEVVS